MEFELPQQLRRRSAGRKLKEPKELVAARLFSDEKSHGASLLIAALQIIPYEELTSYHPHTVRLELQQELKLREIDDDIMARLMAALSILSTDLFYRSLPAFIEICNTLSAVPPLPGFFDPAESDEMAAAIAQSQIIDPLDGNRDIEFNEEILSYMGYQLAEEGFISPPLILKEAIMPPFKTMTEVTDNAHLMETAITADQDRHDYIESVVSGVLSDIKQQVGSLLETDDV